MKSASRSIGAILMNIAVAAYLFATGIIGLVGKSVKIGFVKFSVDGELYNAVTSLFGKGSFSDALVIILAILAIAAGVFILMKFFGIVVPQSELILVILALAWLFFIIMMDIVRPLDKKEPEFIEWLRVFGAHLMVLAGIVLATERFSRG